MDSLFGEIRNLIKKINRVSNGQARIVEIGEFMNIIKIEISPNDGLYKGASFLFKIRVDPYHMKVESPTVLCLTPVYHPNIDTSDLDDTSADDEDYSSNVCLSMLDDWNPSYGLDGLVNGLLFFFYHPEIEDPLSPYISPGMSPEEFSENVHRSLLGEEVDGFYFDRNICDKEYEILRKELDSISELKIENCDPVLSSAESAKEAPLKDNEVIVLPNIEMTMVPNMDSETIVVTISNGQLMANSDTDSQTLLVANPDNETAIVSNQDNATAVVSSEGACESAHENKTLFSKEASNAKPMTFHRLQKDFYSIKSFDRSIPESDIIHTMVDRFLRRFFCCHSDMSND